MRHQHEIAWRAPCPLWQIAADAPGEHPWLRAPALLRFPDAEPLPAMIQLLEQGGERLSAHLALPESWRGAERRSLKLYQPIHGRSYLVAASLICQVPGLPDRTLDPETEQVSMVLRRLTPDGHGEEAWVEAPGLTAQWTAVGSAWIGRHEAELPLQEIEFVCEDRPRRLHVAMLSLVTDRLALLEERRLSGAQVEALWQERVFRPLLELAAITTEQEATLHSTLILCNMARLLMRHQPALWLYLLKGAAQALTPAELQGRPPTQALPTLQPWAPALLATLEGAAGLLDPAASSDTPFFNLQAVATPPWIAHLHQELRESLQGAWDDTALPTQPVSQIDPGLLRDYAVRFVYRRQLPGCDPVVVLSERSAPFQVASLFDPDAPRLVVPNQPQPPMQISRPEWRAPALLWERAAEDPPDLPRAYQPAILRFASDRFMEELQDALEGTAPALDHLVAASETRRREDAGWKPWREAVSAQLKLYQVAHNRFYLVAGTLVDRSAEGKELLIPPHMTDAAFFVMRRLAPVLPVGGVDPKDPRSYREEGWETSGGYGGWQPVPSGDLLETEERHRLYPMGYRAAVQVPAPGIDGPSRAPSMDDRWLHVGFVPTAPGDTYQKGPGFRQTVADLRLRVVRRLYEHLEPRPPVLTAPADGHVDVWVTLLALASLVHRFLPKVWEQVQAQRPAGAGQLIDRLADRLGYAWEHRARVQRGDRSLPDPGLLAAELAPALVEEMEHHLIPLLRKAPPPTDPDQPILDKYNNRRAYYVLRLVYEASGPQGGISWVLSPPSSLFQIAAFVDKQATARPKSEQQKQMEKFLPALLQALRREKG